MSDAVRVTIGQGRKKVILARLCPPQLPEDETWDNARLMAAAPDLMAALRQALVDMKEIARAGQISQGGDHTGNLSLVETARDRVRAAINRIHTVRGGLGPKTGTL